MATKRTEGKVAYYSIVGGNFSQKVDKEHPDARKRTYEDDDGNEITKYEAIFKDVTGHLTGIEFKKGKFGQQVELTLSQGEWKTIVTLPYESDYFTDFAKRVYGADLNEPITLIPYSFRDEEKDRSVRGITLKQGENKLMNAFYDGKKNLHGMPEPDDLTRSEGGDLWKAYFLQVRAFLKKKLMEMDLPKYNAIVDTVEPTPSTKFEPSEEVKANIEMQYPQENDPEEVESRSKDIDDIFKAGRKGSKGKK